MLRNNSSGQNHLRQNPRGDKINRGHGFVVRIENQFDDNLITSTVEQAVFGGIMQVIAYTYKSIIFDLGLR